MDHHQICFCLVCRILIQRLQPRDDHAITQVRRPYPPVERSYEAAVALQALKKEDVMATAGFFAPLKWPPPEFEEAAYN